MEKTLEVWYTARAKFDPSHSEAWEAYIHWAQLPQLTHLLTLDLVLCPEVIKVLIPEDWQYNVQQDYRLFYFRDLDYLLNRLALVAKPFNILGVAWEPACECRYSLADTRFEFQGYELIEARTGISALTNCGGFPLAFRNEALSSVGLLVSYELARQTQRRLRHYYPDEHHAQCELWAIWQMKEG